MDDATTGAGDATRPNLFDTRCVIGEHDGHLRLTVTTPDRVVRGLDLPGARVDLLRRLASRHLRSFSSEQECDPSVIWADATEELLAAVHDLISCPLLALMEDHSRIELRFESGTAARLPIEAACRPGEPALLDLMVVYRSAVHRPRVPVGDRRRRSFSTIITGGVDGDLPSLPLERALVTALGPTGRQPGSQRLIHVAGHDPVLPVGLCRPTERAHAILSGCSSYTSDLVNGITSATMSLWPVGDDSMPSLVGVLAARIAAGVGPAEALRQTQLFHRHLSPSTWAALVHVGEPI